ncbi:putative ubiquitin-conjugating enzyme E2 26 [Dichanthelium oligosanthes]|uniref:Putative ubiquitin-conjugating enzyme E2 26 n=1 Tax=Dichanthelium oligosanthes TaxID=888268 RepID=A0A1E5UM55_9POAL|nr:putative ubiquitin-conjugating enzyme E2 26 [Dichanthelium oligosanthes]
MDAEYVASPPPRSLFLRGFPFDYDRSPWVLGSSRYCGLQQGSSSSCRTADAAAQQQKRQRCQGSSSDQVGSSTSSSLQMSEPEPLDYGEIEEEEDYYMEDDCDDDGDGYDEDDYEFDEADFNQHLADKFDDLDLPPGVEATVPWLQKIAPKEETEETSKSNIADENANKYKEFKQFDTVQNFSDHHFAKSSQGEPARAWSKRVQHDWKLLEKDLPASIYVRVAEDRMDLLRAAIIGPKGTPYHDGLFFFDVHIPSAYPSGPPDDVVLTSEASGGILFLILLLRHSRSCALYCSPTDPCLICGSSQHFADLVAGHFRVHGHTILAACKHYMEGNDIGSVVPEEEEESECKSSDAGASSSSSVAPRPGAAHKANPSTRRSTFNTNLKTLYEDLLMEFNVKGADTRKFIVEKLKKNQPAAV